LLMDMRKLFMLMSLPLYTPTQCRSTSRCNPMSLILLFSLQRDRLALFRQDLETRFKKSIEELKQELHFSAIFIMHGVVYSDLTI
jgi:hypothetical protein